MLGRLYLAIERWARANSGRLDAVCPHVPLWFVRRLSEAKLVRTLRYVWRHSALQRERWQEAGVRRGDLRSPDVLQRLPLLTGKEIVEHPERLFCVPRERFTHIIGSSGTTGPHKTIYLTAEDMARQTRMIGTFYRNFPGVKRAAVWMLLEDESWSAGSITRDSFRRGEIDVIMASTSRSVEEQVALLRDGHIDMIQSTPPYIHRIALESDTPVREFGVRYICLAGMPFTEEFRRRMEETWGAKIMDTYGGAETACGMASECRFQDRLHVTEVDYWVEIIDAQTGRVLPDGEEGEIVITTLSRQGMPLVRYRTADIAALVPRGKRCPCGLPLRKMTRVRGRNDDMLNIGTGDNVFPDELDQAVFSVPDVTDYQLVVEKDAYRDVLHLTVESNSAVEGLREPLRSALMSINSIGKSVRLTKTVAIDRIEVVPPGALAAGRPKSRRIVDRRAGATVGVSFVGVK